MLIKIICGQMDIIPGRPDENYKKILELISAAKEKQADILLLPEMCIPGYLIGDLWEQQTFLDDCQYYAEKIAEASEDLCIMFGNVAFEKDKLNEDGRLRKYNAAVACQNGKILGGYMDRNFIIKNSLPNYREFDDYRYFYSLQKLCAEEDAVVAEALQPLEITIRDKQIKVGLMICEDGWTENYHLNVPQTLANNGAEILFNLSCSPYSLGKNKKRNKLFGAQAKEAGVPLVYCNNVGIQNNGKNVFTYDGCSSAYNADGTLKSTSVPGMFTTAVDNLLKKTANEDKFEAAIYDADGLTKLDEVVVPANLPADQSFARTVEIAQWDKIDSNDFNPAEWEFRNGTEKDSAITPGVNNQVIELNDKIEKFQRLDGTGVMLTVMAMLIVFSALILLSVCFYIFGKINAGIARKNKAVSQGKPEDADHSEVEEDSGEVIAAISTALYQHLNAHDYEETVLTINKVKRAYSPWSSKIYSLRELPNKH